MPYPPGPAPVWKASSSPASPTLAKWSQRWPSSPPSTPSAGSSPTTPCRAGPVAELAQHLGPPGNAPAAVTTCQDPARAHCLLEDRGAPSAQSHTVGDEACAIRFLYPEATGRLVRRKAPAAFTAQPWLDRFAWTQQTGNAVLGPPLSGTEDRLAHWVVTGADSTECNVRLGRIGEQVTARISRLASSPISAL